MSDKLTKLTVGHDFAPGAELTFYELYLQWFVKIMHSPAAVASCVVFTIGITAILIFQLVTRRRQVEEDERRRRGPAAAEEGMDLATLRRSRQARAATPDRMDAA